MPRSRLTVYVFDCNTLKGQPRSFVCLQNGFLEYCISPQYIHGATDENYCAPTDCINIIAQIVN